MRSFLLVAALGCFAVACGASGSATVPDAPAKAGTVDGPTGAADPKDVPGDKTADPGPVSSTAPVQPDSPPASLYDDGGAADVKASLRAVFSFAVRDVASLDAMDDPASPSFHKFLTQSAWLDAHAPAAADLDAVKTWLTGQGFAVPHVASNRLLMEFTGTVGQFQTVFGSEVHVFNRKTPGSSKALDSVIAVVKPVVIPDAIKDRTRGVLALAPAASTVPLPTETATKQDSPPNPEDGFSPQQVAEQYGITALGKQGDGETIGVVMGAAFKRPDARAFWHAFGITREDPEVVVVGEGPSIRAVEASVDIEWSAALAPAAHMIAYQAADVHDLALLLAFNEAIGAGKATVVTDSFAHRETNVSKMIAQQYEVSAQMGAATGVTIISPSGDSNGVDIPATCPHVTAVGGTTLAGVGADETVWSQAGAGPSHFFDTPAWQSVSANKRRVIPDVSVVADPSTPYWTLHLGDWVQLGGTSFGSPVFAAMIANVNSDRTAAGKSRTGLLNPTLYSTKAVSASFIDIVSGTADATNAAPGWDMASGWGSPRADQLAAALP